MSKRHRFQESHLKELRHMDASSPKFVSLVKELPDGDLLLKLKANRSDDATKKFKSHCYICGQDKGIAEEFHSEIILDDEREVWIKGLFTDKTGEPIPICKRCVTSLFYTATELFHEEEDSAIFHEGSDCSYQ